jgi:hypothetical protein
VKYGEDLCQIRFHRSKSVTSDTNVFSVCSTVDAERWRSDSPAAAGEGWNWWELVTKLATGKEDEMGGIAGSDEKNDSTGGMQDLREEWKIRFAEDEHR